MDAGREDVPPRAASPLRAGGAALVRSAGVALAEVAEVAYGVDHLGPSLVQVVRAPRRRPGPAASDPVGDEGGALAISRMVWRTCSGSISSAGVRPARWAASTLGVTRSTMSRRKPPGTSPVRTAASAADRAARVVAEHDDEREVEHADAELERAEHAGVDDVAGRADDEEVAEALVEDDLRGDARVGAAEEDRERVCLAAIRCRKCTSWCGWARSSAMNLALPAAARARPPRACGAASPAVCGAARSRSTLPAAPAPRARRDGSGPARLVRRPRAATGADTGRCASRS